MRQLVKALPYALSDTVHFTVPKIRAFVQPKLSRLYIPFDHCRPILRHYNETAWRQELSEMELEYLVGVQSVTTVWSKGTGPLPPPSRQRGWDGHRRGGDAVRVPCQGV